MKGKIWIMIDIDYTMCIVRWFWLLFLYRFGIVWIYEMEHDCDLKFQKKMFTGCDW
jgi:hypothetical protein